MPKVAVCLSGCGFLDGAELTEAVSVLIALDLAGATATCCAPAGAQVHVIDHLTRQPVAGATRTMLGEAARIARGKIVDLATIEPADFDALILPGGFGAAKNLCSFASEGAACTVHPQVARVINGFHDAGKPIGAICIAPAIVARVLGVRGIAVKLTIGNDRGTAAAIEQMGARHEACPVERHVIDEQQRVVTTPAYMYDTTPGAVFTGVQGCVGAVLKLAATPPATKPSGARA